MKTWHVTTGNYRRRVVAPSPKEAVIEAFRDDPPWTPGILTQVKERNGVAFYLDTIECLQKARHKIKKRRIG